MAQQSHKNAAKSFKDASDHHEEAAKHTASGKKDDAAKSLKTANQHAEEGMKHSKEAADKHSKNETK